MYRTESHLACAAAKYIFRQKSLSAALMCTRDTFGFHSNGVLKRVLLHFDGKHVAPRGRCCGGSPERILTAVVGRRQITELFQLFRFRF